MTPQEEFLALPSWVQELWHTTPRLAREAERALDEKDEIIKGLFATIRDISEYTGEGRINAPWQQIVASIGKQAAEAVRVYESKGSVQCTKCDKHAGCTRPEKKYAMHRCSEFRVIEVFPKYCGTCATFKDCFAQSSEIINADGFEPVDDYEKSKKIPACHEYKAIERKDNV